MGSGMNYTALKVAILANADCTPYVVTNDMPKDPDYYAKDSAIAAIFNTSSGTRLVERYENAIGIMSALGAVTGAAILEKLDQAKAGIPALKWAMLAMDDPQGVNLGDPETQGMLDGLVVANVITQTEADAIKALAILPSSLAYETVGQPITAADVSIALRNY
jgi:hypothetical protein